MANKKLIIGIAAGAAALAATLIVLGRQKSSKRKYNEQVEEAKEHFKGKLHDLQRKAKKQYKNSPDETKETIAGAKSRAGKTSNA